MSVPVDGRGLKACGNCGSDEVRMRARGSSGSRCTAQVVCARCSAQSELCVGADAVAQAAKAWGHRRSAPPTPPAAGRCAIECRSRNPPCGEIRSN